MAVTQYYIALQPNCCRDDRIRTCGPYVPNVVRYRAAPHPEFHLIWVTSPGSKFIFQAPICKILEQYENHLVRHQFRIKPDLVQRYTSVPYDSYLSIGFLSFFGVVVRDYLLICSWFLRSSFGIRSGVLREFFGKTARNTLETPKNSRRTFE